MTKEKEIELKILKEWEKEIGADKWSVWDSITSENIDLLLHKGFLAGQNFQKEKDLEMIECFICDDKNCDECKSFRFLKQQISRKRNIKNNDDDTTGCRLNIKRSVTL